MSDKDNNDLKKFRPRARLLLQLGDQLIRSENIAIIELVKNAYDANASECNVVGRNIDNKETGEIVITDNGDGMTGDLVRNVWLEPGADFKQQILEHGDQVVFDFKFDQSKRTPIGEKGVGRFGVHKLGNKIEVISKSKLSPKEIRIYIDWEKFGEEKYLDDATFVVEERDPIVFTEGKTGTRITINTLRKEWDRKTYRDLTRSLSSLSSPFLSNDSFVVKQALELKDKATQKSWELGIIDQETIKKAALWELDCTLRGKEIVSFDLSFRPWKTLLLDERSITLDDLKVTNRHKLHRIIGRGVEEPINLTDHNIGDVRIRAYFFDLELQTLRYSPLVPADVRSYLGSNGGVKVYRDNFRIYNYGEIGDDWLDLDKDRINNPTKRIGNRNLLGAVMLDRKTSRSLIEKTNREGFVEDQAFFAFADAVRNVIDICATQRALDKEKIRSLEQRVKEKQPVVYEVEEMKNFVDNKLTNVEMDNKPLFIKDLHEGLDRIQEQFTRASEILIQSSNMGISFGVVVHEVDKRLSRLKHLVDSKNIDVKLVRESVRDTVEIVEHYSAITATQKKTADLKSTLDIALMSVEFRFKAHGIECIKAYEEKDDERIDISLNNVVGILLNIFDNSIYWLNKYGVEERKIFITTRHYDDQVGIVIADNGKGFALSFEDALKPFYTLKDVGGHGLGLHIVDEIMKAHQGAFVERSAQEVEGLPAEFHQGAILELIFKTKKNGSQKSRRTK
jgi:signal transduction histidine kinase